MAYILTNIYADETIEIAQNIIGLLAAFNRKIIQRSSNFTAHAVTEKLKGYYNEHHLISTCVQRAYGQAKLYMRIILDMLDTLKNELSNKVWNIELILNITIQKSSGLPYVCLLIS